MSRRTRYALIAYFSILILISIFLLVLLWNPIQGSLTAIKKTTQVIEGPNKNKTIISEIKNSRSSSDKLNITKTTTTSNNVTTKIENITIKPLSGQAFGTDPEIVFTN